MSGADITIIILGEKKHSKQGSKEVADHLHPTLQFDS
jgi:hypothetical protein